MLLYFIILLITILINLAAIKYGYKKEYCLMLSFFLLAIFVGISEMLGGYDRYIYGELFDGIADITRVNGK